MMVYLKKFRAISLALLAILVASLVIGWGMDAAWAQSVTLDMGTADTNDGSFAARLIQIIALLTVLSLAPSILVMMTSFTRIIVVLSLMRTAMGVQQTPPNTVMISLALFLTLFVMMPTFQEAYNQGILPFINEEITEQEAFTQTVNPVKRFMLSQVRDKDLQLFAGLADINPDTDETIQEAEDLPLHVVIPGFMISELRRAFEMGFLLFLPFLVIDMVTASILMSMGMMMLPPVIISLPFKLIFFVFIDGWYLISGSLVQSFGTSLPDALPAQGIGEVLPGVATPDGVAP